MMSPLLVTVQNGMTKITIACNLRYSQTYGFRYDTKELVFSHTSVSMMGRIYHLRD
jgi:hypothetical protein